MGYTDSDFDPKFETNTSISSKIRIIDPNPTQKIVPHEDLFIYISLRAKQKSKTVLTETSSNINISTDFKNDIDLTVPQRTVITDGDEVVSKNVLFKNKPNLTTDWTEIGGKFLESDLYTDFEGFGITNIDIQIQSQTTPKVVVDFVDVRGATLFEQGSCSPYGLFFSLPYPLFELTIKGYYGKPVKYYLNLVKFNTKFNSSTGNMECRAEFIGYTFAFLSDTIMGFVNASQYLDPIKYAPQGKLRNKYSDTTTFYRQNKLNVEGADYGPWCDNDSIGVGRCATIMDIVKRLDLFEKEDKPEIAGSNEFIELQKLNELEGYYRDYLANIEDLIKELNEAKIKSEITNYPSAQDKTKFIFTTDNEIEGVQVTLDTYLDKETGSFLGFIKEIKTFEISTGQYADTLELGNSAQGQPLGVRLLSSVTAEDILQAKEDDTAISPGSIFDDLNKQLFQNEVLPKVEDCSGCKTYKNSPQESTNATKYLDVGWIKNSLEEEKKLLDELINIKKEEARKAVNEIIEKRIGFNPTIRNIFTVILCNVDAYMEILLDVYGRAEIQHNEENYEAYAKNTGKQLLTAGFKNDGISPRVFPWPTYYVENFTKGGKKQGTKEDYPGEEFPEWVECQFIEDFIKAYMLMQEDIDILNGNLEGKPGYDFYTPINPLESPQWNSSNPNRYKDLTLNSKNPTNDSFDIERVILERAIISLDHSNIDLMRFGSYFDDVTNIPNMRTRSTMSSIINQNATGGGGSNYIDVMGAIDAHNFLNTMDKEAGEKTLRFFNNKWGDIEKFKDDLNKSWDNYYKVEAGNNFVREEVEWSTQDVSTDLLQQANDRKETFIKYGVGPEGILLNPPLGTDEIRIYPNAGDMPAENLIKILDQGDESEWRKIIVCRSEGDGEGTSGNCAFQKTQDTLMGRLRNGIKKVIESSFPDQGSSIYINGGNIGVGGPQPIDTNIFVPSKPDGSGGFLPTWGQKDWRLYTTLFAGYNWTYGSTLTGNIGADDKASKWWEAGGDISQLPVGAIGQTIFYNENDDTSSTYWATNGANLLSTFVPGDNDGFLYDSGLAKQAVSDKAYTDNKNSLDWLGVTWEFEDNSLETQTHIGSNSVLPTLPLWLDNVNSFRIATNNGNNNSFKLKTFDNLAERTHGRTFSTEDTQHLNLAYLFLHSLKPTPLIIKPTEAAELGYQQFASKDTQTQRSSIWTLAAFMNTAGMAKVPKFWLLALGAQLWRWKCFVGLDDNDNWIKPWNFKNGKNPLNRPNGYDPLAQPGYNSTLGKNSFLSPDGLKPYSTGIDTVRKFAAQVDLDWASNNFRNNITGYLSYIYGGVDSPCYNPNTQTGSECEKWYNWYENNLQTSSFHFNTQNYQGGNVAEQYRNTGSDPYLDKFCWIFFPYFNIANGVVPGYRSRIGVDIEGDFLGDDPTPLLGWGYDSNIAGVDSNGNPVFFNGVLKALGPVRYNWGVKNGYSWSQKWISPHHIPYVQPGQFTGDVQASGNFFQIIMDNQLNAFDYSSMMSISIFGSTYFDSAKGDKSGFDAMERTRAMDGNLGAILQYLPDGVKNEIVNKFIDWALSDQFTDSILPEFDPLNFSSGTIKGNLGDSYENQPYNDNELVIALGQNDIYNALVLKNEGNSIDTFKSEYYWILNSTPKIWYGLPNSEKDKTISNWGEAGAVTSEKYSPENINSHFYIRKDFLNLYRESFFNTFKDNVDDRIKEINKTNTQDDLSLGGDTVLDDDDVKLALYRTFKSIADKWISGSVRDKLFFNLIDDTGSKCKSAYQEGKPTLASHFQYVNRVMGDIGDIAVIDPTKLNQLKENPKITLYQYLSDVLTENEYLFFPLPAYINFTADGVGSDDLKDMFRPVNDLSSVSCGPLFLSVYVGGNSRNLKLTTKANCPIDKEILNSVTEDDSFNLTGYGPKPEEVKGTDDSGTESVGFTAFKVVYGLENQNHFTNIELDQSEFSETAESLMIIDKLSNQNGGNKTSKGQNLNAAYLTRSYTCQVESLGNLMIQPMTYFDLLGVPMFNGTYLITEVNHNFKPNHAKTTFKGRRQPRMTVPIVTDASVAMNISFKDLKDIKATGKPISDSNIGTRRANPKTGEELYPDISDDILKLFDNPVPCSCNPQITSPIFRTSNGQFHGGVDIGFGAPDEKYSKPIAVTMTPRSGGSIGGGTKTATRNEKSQKVYAMYDGIVTNSGAAGGYGNPNVKYKDSDSGGGWVVIRHGKNGGKEPFDDGFYIFTVYGHVTPKSGLEPNQSIKKGDLIGKAVWPNLSSDQPNYSNAVYNDGLHLHLQVHRSKTTQVPSGKVKVIDPALVLNKNKDCITGVNVPTFSSGGDTGIVTNTQTTAATDKEIKKYYEDVLKGIGAPKTVGNVNFLKAWRQAEGGKAAWNIFNTTLPKDGATNYNTVKVKNYKSLEQGVEATVETILNSGDRNGKFYTNIIKTLKDGVPENKDEAANIAKNNLQQKGQDFWKWVRGPYSEKGPLVSYVYAVLKAGVKDVPIYKNINEGLASGTEGKVNDIE